MTDPTPTPAEVEARLSKIVHYEYSSADALIHNCDLGYITMGDVQVLLAALTESRRAESAAWNDAIEAAGNLESIHGYSNAVPRHRIRALRRAAPTEDR